MARDRLNYEYNEKKEAKATSKKLGLPCLAWTRKVRASTWVLGTPRRASTLGIICQGA